jgi:regulating synaptic membrane exocytosis protein 2
MSPQGKQRAAGMVAKDYRTVSGVGQGYYNQTTAQRRTDRIAQRSHSAAPSDNYPEDRRGSLSPADDRYTEYPVLPFNDPYYKQKSRSATATPTGSPKKRQLPQVPHISRNSNRLIQDFEERGGRFTRYRINRGHQPHTYRSTGTG